jgi:poly(hydroxyalkanoate) depolymerase family esterase
MLKALLDRIRAFVTRVFRREPEPGRFETGTAGTWRGWLASAPLVLPRRDYLVYVPRGHSRWRRVPLVVLCHGCKQSPEEIAAATRITEVADRNGWLVLLPRQKESANAWGCWNWFDSRTARGTGEAAILLAQVDAVAREHRADHDRVVVAGMSAGGALSAAVALHHAGALRAVFVHSGLACGAASAPIAAQSVMKRGPDTDVEALARAVRRDEPQAPRVPLCVVHGEADDIVAPVNAAALVRQFLRLHEHPTLERGNTDASGLPPADYEAAIEAAGGRVVTTREWRTEQALVVRYVAVAGLAHAWSGGDPQYPFNDPAPPPATDVLERFVRETLEGPRAAARA